MCPLAGKGTGLTRFGKLSGRLDRAVAECVCPLAGMATPLTPFRKCVSRCDSVVANHVRVVKGMATVLTPHAKVAGMADEYVAMVVCPLMGMFTALTGARKNDAADDLHVVEHQVRPAVGVATGRTPRRKGRSDAEALVATRRRRRVRGAAKLTPWTPFFHPSRRADVRVLRRVRRRPGPLQDRFLGGRGARGAR